MEDSPAAAQNLRVGDRDGRRAAPRRFPRRPASHGRPGRAGCPRMSKWWTSTDRWHLVRDCAASGGHERGASRQCSPSAYAEDDGLRGGAAGACEAVLGGGWRRFDRKALPTPAPAPARPTKNRGPWFSASRLRNALQLAVPAATAARDKLHDALSPAIGNIRF